MPVDYTEKGFEQAIEDHLLHHGYRNGDPANFDASLALDTKTLVEFLGVTQKDEWGRLSNSNNSGDTILNFSEFGMVSPDLEGDSATGYQQSCSKPAESGSIILTAHTCSPARCDRVRQWSSWSAMVWSC